MAFCFSLIQSGFSLLFDVCLDSRAFWRSAAEFVVLDNHRIDGSILGDDDFLWSIPLGEAILPPLADSSANGWALYCIYMLFTVTASPEVPDATMKSMRLFWSHPFLFMALWAHRMIFDLFCGMMLNRTKEGEGWAGKLSLLLIWLLGPIGLMIFAVRYWASFNERLPKKKQRK